MTGWTEVEEKAFKSIMEAGSLERMPAIRLYRRCLCDIDKALRIAKDCYGITNGLMLKNRH